jgi:hypothetical protein
MSSTFITVTTQQSGFVFVGPSYQYKTITEAFLDNKFQIVIPDQYTVENTAIFQSDIIYSITVLDELIVPQFNINLDGIKASSLILDGHGVVRFTTSKPFNYMNSIDGLGVYLNNTRINSDVPFSIDAQYINIIGTMFVGDFQVSFNNYSNSTGGIVNITSSSFKPDVLILDPLVDSTYYANIVSTYFISKLIVKCTRTGIVSPAAYNAFINISTSVILNLAIHSDGLNVISPSINILGSIILELDDSLPCALVFSGMSDCTIGSSTGYFPDLVVSNLSNCFITSSVIIGSTMGATITSCFFADNLTITDMKTSSINTSNIARSYSIDNLTSSTVTSCIVDNLTIGTCETSIISNNSLSGELNVTSMKYSAISFCNVANMIAVNSMEYCSLISNSTEGNLDIPTSMNSTVMSCYANNLILLTCTNVRLEFNTILTDITIDNMTDSDILYNLVPSISVITMLRSSIIGQKNTSLTLASVTSSTLASNIFSTNINMSSIYNLTFTGNSAEVQVNLICDNIEIFTYTGNTLINPVVNVLAKDGLFTSNVLGLITLASSSNVTTTGNIIV